MSVQLECGVKKGDAVDLEIEVRSSTESGLLESAVLNSLGVAGVGSVGVNVCEVGGDVAVSVNGHSVGHVVAGDGESGAVKDLEFAGLELCGGVGNCLGSALGSDGSR